jgi:L-asparaginase / beta-aspartyl-peptidase
MAAVEKVSDGRFTIVVHGGAWNIPETLCAASEEGCQRAVAAASRVLAAGGSALDAVETAVRSLEDDPVFDAGTGSVLTSQGKVEMDAMIMDGCSLRAGAVAAVSDVQNPVSLARLVMENTQHVLLVGAGAAAFAEQQGVPRVDPATLVSAEARREVRRGQALHGYR